MGSTEFAPEDAMATQSGIRIERSNLARSFVDPKDLIRFRIDRSNTSASSIQYDPPLMGFCDHKLFTPSHCILANNLKLEHMAWSSNYG